MKKFVSTQDYKNYERVLTTKKSLSNNSDKVVNNIENLFSKLCIEDNITVSYHHHLRNGDYVVNMVMDYIHQNYNININIAASSIFQSHNSINKLINDKRVNNIYTNYISGEVAKSVEKKLLNEYIYMHTHGGRARAIESGDIKIDIAFLAVSECDKFGNSNGVNGKSACGSLGYALSDLEYASTVVLVTDNLVENVEIKEIDGKYVDYILVVDSIGNPSGIVSGTTQVTKNPVGLKIARDSAKLANDLGLIKNGISMQTGAGGTSLAVADAVASIMRKNGVKGSYASGGITKYFVDMLEEGLFEKLYDVQCFDLSAVKSLISNENHFAMSASKYANPYDEPVVNGLDIVVLGATEVDLDFNVNVTTSSSSNLIGGSGGHSDTAYGANLTIITSPLIKGRIPLVKNRVTTISTPGESIDAIVTERGIAINPRRTDLLELLKDSDLNIVTIEELQKMAHDLCGVPDEIEVSNEIIGYVVYRDGSVIDTLYKCNV